MYTLKETEKLVDRSFFLTWDGWDVKAINPKHDGYARPDGIFYNGKWSTFITIKANKEGLYDLPRKYSSNTGTARR